MPRHHSAAKPCHDQRAAPSRRVRSAAGPRFCRGAAPSHRRRKTAVTAPPGHATTDPQRHRTVLLPVGSAKLTVDCWFGGSNKTSTQACRRAFAWLSLCHRAAPLPTQSLSQRRRAAPGIAAGDVAADGVAGGVIATSSITGDGSAGGWSWQKAARRLGWQHAGSHGVAVGGFVTEGSAASRPAALRRQVVSRRRGSATVSRAACGSAAGGRLRSGLRCNGRQWDGRRRGGWQR